MNKNKEVFKYVILSHKLMVNIESEGKFDDNSYLIDGMVFRLPSQLSLYLIENNRTRILLLIQRL